MNKDFNRFILVIGIFSIVIATILMFYRTITTFDVLIILFVVAFLAFASSYWDNDDNDNNTT